MGDAQSSAPTNAKHPHPYSQHGGNPDACDEYYFKDSGPRNVGIRTRLGRDRKRHIHNLQQMQMTISHLLKSKRDPQIQPYLWSSYQPFSQLLLYMDGIQRATSTTSYCIEQL